MRNRLDRKLHTRAGLGTRLRASKQVDMIGKSPRHAAMRESVYQKRTFLRRVNTYIQGSIRTLEKDCLPNCVLLADRGQIE